MSASSARRRPRPGMNSDRASRRLVLPAPFSPTSATSGRDDREVEARIGAEILKDEARDRGGRAVRGHDSAPLFRGADSKDQAPRGPRLRSSGRQAYRDGSALDPHRHQHVERRRALAVLDQGRRAGIGELEQGRVAVELAGDVEEIAGVEADIERRRIVIDLDLLGGAAGIRIVDRERQAAVASASFTARPRSDEIVETRSTALAKSLRSTVRSLSLPVGMTRW